MKNLYMFQVNYSYGKSVHLPYTAGALLSYAFACKDVSENYRFQKILYLREEPEKAVEKLENPDVIGFSSYIWNFEFNKATAKLIKEKYPDCIIIFGGHHVSPGGDLLDECGYIDYLIHGEGEEAFRRLLLYICGRETISDIGGISYRTEGGIVTTPNEMLCGDVIDYPSPYLNGYFDDILKSAPDRDYMAVIETTRGCPNNCSYCDWSNMKSRIRKFPMQRVLDEIRWISEHKIVGLGSADSNFGVFERDEEITNFIIEMHNKNDCPIGYQTSFAKNSNDRVFRIGLALEKNHMSKGITLSFQSMSDEVLENIGRKNIPVSHYSELMDRYNAAGVSTYTELILGLPGETPESFAAGIDKLLELGQHNLIYIHNCEWLPCSVMGSRDYVEKYKIRTARILLNQPHIEKASNDSIDEYSNLVVSTYSMTPEDWKQMNLFSFVVQSFHHLGVLQLFALYLHNEKAVPYRVFYERLLKWLLNDCLCLKDSMHCITQRLDAVSVSAPGACFTVEDSDFGKVSWPFEEYLFLCTIRKYEAFFAEAEGFLRTFDIDNDVFDELFYFQKHMIKRPFFRGETLEYNYNFDEYFALALKNKRTELKKERRRFDIKAKYYDDFAKYAKYIAWYSRKDSSSLYLDTERFERNC